MKDQRTERLADILVNYSCPVKRDDLVLIRGTYLAEPLILAVYERCLRKGAHPVIRAAIPAAEPVFFKIAQDHQLEYIWETEKWLYDNLDVSYYILSESNTRQMSKVDPERVNIARRARKPLTDVYMERAAAGDYLWNVTLFPTEAAAMDAEMSLAEYEDFYYGACLVDADDPISEWKKVGERHAEMIDWIKDRREIHLLGAGTDLYLDVTDRRWEPADGKENFPDGEIFTGPVETSTRGHVSFSFPAIFGGVAVEGIELEFQDGTVVDASAQRNEKFLLDTLETDPGARILGEIGIGTNYGITDFSGEILLDEKIGGTVHLAIGSSYPETGGLNESAVHWDMVCDLRDGGRIEVDGDTMLEDGRLTI
jgi:aminopeptidase